MQPSEWQKLWLGGFCAPGIYGSPVRQADPLPRPSLAQCLTLPLERNGSHGANQAIECWSQYLGGRPIMLARSLDEARSHLLRTLGMTKNEPVLLPANASHALVECIKQQGAKPVFGELDPNLTVSTPHYSRVAWLQPPLGIPTQHALSADFTVLDHGDSIPRNRLGTGTAQAHADVEIYGLYLTHDPRHAGALLVFNHEALYARSMAEQQEEEPHLYTRAAAQLERLKGIMPAQEAALDLVWTGLQAAAGLPLLPITPGAALPHGVLVGVPDEGSPSLFWSYASRENTPIQWLPEVRPIHYAAIATHASSAAHLERWLFVPVVPDDDFALLKQAVLGVVKTAEYLGLRWRTDPQRAAEYAARLDEIYGPDHDAYRPAFALPLDLDFNRVLAVEDFLTQACSLSVPGT